jgi:hypothetical protein
MSHPIWSATRQGCQARRERFAEGPTHSVEERSRDEREAELDTEAGGSTVDVERESVAAALNSARRRRGRRRDERTGAVRGPREVATHIHEMVDADR